MTEPVWTDIFDYDGLNLIRKPTGCTPSDAKYSGKIAGGIIPVKGNKYIRVWAAGRTCMAHRVIFEMHHGPIPKGMQIDHIDGDGTNNRLSNLRLVTVAGNNKNKQLYKLNKTGVQGVFWDKTRGNYRVSFRADGKDTTLGRSKDFFEAVCIRKSAEVKYGYHENHGRRAKQ